MNDDTVDSRDLTDLSDEEIEEMSEDFMEAAPDAMGQAMGIDFVAKMSETERREFEQEFPDQIEELLIGFRDAMAKNSEEEQALALFEVYNWMTEQIMMGEEARKEFDTGLEFLIDRLRVSIEYSRKAMEELGYVEYFDTVYGFAVDIFEAGRAGEVKEFLDNLEGDSRQTILQRVLNPVIMEYYQYLEEHPEITDGGEARQYIDMYEELAELVSNLLPQFIAVIGLVSDQDEEYDDLKQMKLNNLLQKLESKKYSRFNELAEGIDRELRNSIAHRDFTVDPINEEIKFRDRGELVAELDYTEFQEEVFKLLALFNALWNFQMILIYYRIHHLPQTIEDLREKVSDSH